MELFTERPSLLILNEYCLLEIFKFLELDDSMNLAECCNRIRRVADRTFKIKSNFVINRNMFRKGDNYIDRVFTHIGQNVSRLTINCYSPQFEQSNGFHPNLYKIISDCNNLKSLRILNWRRHECHFDSTLQNFDKIELLYLWYCDLGNLKTFLKNFYKLKFLTIMRCWNNNEELMATLLSNNPEMESLSYFNVKTGNDFRILPLLERIPKVKRLGIDIFRIVTTTELNSLLTLNVLTKLRLDCNRKNINNILNGLDRKGIMEEMELNFIQIDDNFFDILKSFVRLQLLVLHADGRVKLKSSTIWPTNLKRLRLEYIEFTHLSFISTIQQMKSLESVDISNCTIAESDVADFKNVAKLSRDILNVMDHDNRKQRLEVVLPRNLLVFPLDLLEGGDSKTHFLVDSKPLRILLTTNFNPFKTEIHFSGSDP